MPEVRKADRDAAEEIVRLPKCSVNNAAAIIARHMEPERALAAEYIEDAFKQIAFEVGSNRTTDDAPSKYTGWWDSQALTTACELGDWLVSNGTWERHPDGFGRRWFYRPISNGAKQ